jgi:protein-L-isoaspartate(D-aspartate) O-methyltransferase
VPPDERFAAARRTKVAKQLRGRDITDERVLAAMERVPRELFVPKELRRRAYDDAALPLPLDQSISQPYIVAKIAETLGLHGDELVLDVGTGSGYGAAVLAELAREVVSIERIPALAAQARANLEAAGYGRVQTLVGDATLGVPGLGPFDAIAVAAAAPSLPQAIYEQLVPNGRMAVPLGDESGQLLVLVVRSPEGPAVLRSTPVRFVPLIGEGRFS